MVQVIALSGHWYAGIDQCIPHIIWVHLKTDTFNVTSKVKHLVNYKPHVVTEHACTRECPLACLATISDSHRKYTLCYELNIQHSRQMTIQHMLSYTGM